MSTQESTPQSRYLVGSVARALRMVDLVADAPDGLPLSEMARSLGTSKSTAHALARTLVAGGYLRTVAPGPRYKPGMELRAPRRGRDAVDPRRPSVPPGAARAEPSQPA